MILDTIDSKNKWDFITNFLCSNYKIKSVNFNILYEGIDLDQFISLHNNSFIGFIEDRNNKMYYTGKYVSFIFDDKLRNFIINFNLKNFYNFCVEDPSISIGDRDVISIISHEDEILIDENWVDSAIFRNIGFDLNNIIEGYYN